MKTLLLMRHAKSNLSDKVDADRKRSLSKRGKKDAERIGELLKQKKVAPDLILASNAVRSHQTAEIMMDAMHYEGDICLLSKLYMAETEVYIQAIQKISDEVNTVMIIGHNPALECLLQILTNKVESLSTAAVGHLSLQIESWKDFQPDLQADLIDLWNPKESGKQDTKKQSK